MKTYEVFRCERCGRTSRGKKCRYCPKRLTAVLIALALALVLALSGCAGVVVVGDHTSVHQSNEVGQPGQATAAEDESDVWDEGIIILLYVLAIAVFGMVVFVLLH
jgi:uncharacterized protein YceK